MSLMPSTSPDPAVTPRAEREFDIVLVGATGFVGRLTAEYLASHAPAGLRWALAGRNEEKLQDVRDELARIDPALADLPLITVDLGDPVLLGEVVGRTAVLVSTVGPYLKFGGPLVAACAAAGTDYLDLTGEPEFVDRTFLHDDAVARRTGARLVHACGFDSIPHDLGALFTVRELAAQGPVTMRGVVRSSAAFSGGTFGSALNQMAQMRSAKSTAAARRREERRDRAGSERSARPVAGKPHRDDELGYWLLPLPTIDPAIVARSAAALPEYGSSFRYSHYAGLKTLRYAAGGAAAVAGIATVARIGPLRRLLESRVPAGSGPDEERRARSWFRVDFVAEGDGRSIHTRVSGGDPGYDETAKMLAEAALCLRFDDNPETAGQVTTAQAMGENLIDRLIAAGIRFEVID